MSTLAALARKRLQRLLASRQLAEKALQAVTEGVNLGPAEWRRVVEQLRREFSNEPEALDRVLRVLADVVTELRLKGGLH